MKILITGNMGYIGPGVVKELRASYPRAAIAGLDTGFFSHCLTHAPVFPETRVDEQYFLDVRRVPDGVLKGVDAIIYLAAISNDIMGKINEKVTMDVNCHAAVRLARQARQKGVKSFVFASSCSVYGFAEEAPRTERSALNPLTAYARSKVLAEKKLRSLASKKFRVTCFRFATACGMSERLRLDLVLNDFVAGAVTAKKISILSDGTPWRPLIHVADMARAFAWGVTRPVAAGGTFLTVNAGSTEWNYQVRDLARAVEREVPGVDVSINKDAPPDKRSYRVDFSLFRKLAPKHQPRITLPEAVRGLREGLAAMRFADTDFRNSHLMRLNVLTSLRDAGRLNERLMWTGK